MLAEKIKRLVSQVVSAEKEECITFGAFITAIGNTILPVFVLPRVHYKTHFLLGSSEGSLGLASRTDWINTDLFFGCVETYTKTHELYERMMIKKDESHDSIVIK